MVEVLWVIEDADSTLLCQSRIVVLTGLLVRTCTGSSSLTVTVVVELGPMGG